MSVRTTRRNPSGIAFLIILFMAAAASGDDAKKTAWAPRPKSASNAEGSGAGKTDSLPSGAVARLGHVRLRHSDRRIDQLAFAPDGRLVASTGGGPIKLWDTSTGTLVRQLAGHAGPVGLRTSSVAFSPDGKLLASGGYGWTAAIWDVETVRTASVGWVRYGRFTWPLLPAANLSSPAELRA
jgi:WD40 repeat protein